MVFRGVATALITPFTNEKIDFESLDKLIDYQIDSKVDALVVLGTTGEPSTLSQEEKNAVVTAAVRRVRGRIPVIVGAGSNDTATAVASCKNAERLGADGILSVTPYYNKCTMTGLVAHYRALALSTSLPIICYNVPGRTGVNMLPSAFSELAQYENVVGVKEASGNMEQILEYIRIADGRTSVYSGDDALTIPVLAAGGDGVISVVSNVRAEYVVEMVRLFYSGNLERASAMQRKMLPLVRATFLEVNPIPVKYAASLKGFGDGSLRLPLTRMGEDNAATLRRALAECTM